MKHVYKRFVDAYINLARRHPVVILAVFLAAGAIGLYVAASKIQIETDLGALLPEGTDSVRALEMSESRIGAIDYFTIAIESKSKDVQAIARVQDALEDHIRKEWKDATWVQTRRETDFFRKHALYYLEDQELKNLRDLLREELSMASAKKMPGMVSLLDDDEEESGLDSWYSEDIPWRMGLPSQVRKSFNDFFRKDAECPEEHPGKIDEEKIAPIIANRLIAAEGDVGVVLVKLEKASTDITYSKAALARGEALIRDINPQQYDPGMKVEVVGAYRKFLEIVAISRDGSTATIISVLLVLSLLFLFFRSFRTIAVVFLPLLVAGSITMGIVGLTYQRLTVLTIFILALLVGMGIDYGIHLFGRFKLEINEGKDLVIALTTSLYETGRALLVAAATTIASMLTLLFGHFEGFREFGVVASFGLAICVASSMLMLPPMAFLIQRLRPLRRTIKEDRRQWDHTFTLFGLNIRQIAATAFGLTMLVVLGLSVFAPDTQFEYDIRNIMAPGTDTPIEYMRAIGKDSGTAPAIVLGKSRKQMQEVHEYLLNKMVVEQDENLLSFITYNTFVPPMEKQLQRKKTIDQIGKVVRKKAMQDMKGDTGELVAELTKMTEATPFDHKALPDWAKRIVTEANGDIGHVGHIYAKIDDWNVYSGQEFQEHYGNLKFDGSWLPIASSRFILSDVVRMVKADGLRLLIIVSLVLLVILYLFCRCLKSTLLLFGVLAVGGIWCAGIMGFFDIRISLYNIIVIPVILGVGIDGAVHLYHKYTGHPGSHIGEIFRTTGMTISASSLTTITGFVGLLFVEHKGLQTIGYLGTIGIATSWLAVMLLMPFLLDRLPIERGAKKAENS